MKDIDNMTTIWPAEARPWYKRIIRKIYVRFVGEIYIPNGLTVTFVREKQRTHPKFNKITHITFRKGNVTAKEFYLFDDFNNFIEHDQS